MEQQFFTENWEARLNALLNWSEIPEKSAYICSPLRAEQAEMTKQNMLAARAYMLYAYERMQYRARAPHAFLPILLCDHHSDERILALQFGLSLMESCDEVMVCGNRMTTGMVGEIVQAITLKKRIVVFDENLHHEVMKLVLSNQGCRAYARLDQKHPVMAHPQPHTVF